MRGRKNVWWEIKKHNTKIPEHINPKLSYKNTKTHNPRAKLQELIKK